jgi:hypothetical protein
MKEIFHNQNSAKISCQVYSASLLVVSAGNFQIAVVEESGMIRNQMGTEN